MAFFIRDCVRCGVKRIQHIVVGESAIDKYRQREISGACSDCKKVSIYSWISPDSTIRYHNMDGNLEYDDYCLGESPIRIAVTSIDLSGHIPERIAGLFREANECRQMTYYEASGAMFRKTIDVATKYIYDRDERLKDKKPADALRVRIKSLGEMKILEQDIVELADIAALDGNDAAHDVDPYTKEEAEALEELTSDLLERLFVRPARVAAVRAKQVEAGVRKE